jgi:hypothetical protein
VDVDARVTPVRARRDADFNVGAVAAEQLVQGAGFAVAEDRPGASNENSRHPPTLAHQEVRWDEGIDAPMDSMQATSSGAVLNGARRQAELT